MALSRSVHGDIRHLEKMTKMRKEKRIVHGDIRHLEMRYYKRGTWETSRNCLMRWNEERQRWDNSSELGFRNIEYSLKITGRKYDLIDFEKQTRKSG